jgi:hypothetical protein
MITAGTLARNRASSVTAGQFRRASHHAGHGATTSARTLTISATRRLSHNGDQSAVIKDLQL